MATQVVGVLTGKALASYVALGSEDISDYTKVKAAILHYDVNDEIHRQRVHSDKKSAEESYKSFICWTVDNFD